MNKLMIHQMDSSYSFIREDLCFIVHVLQAAERIFVVGEVNECESHRFPKDRTVFLILSLILSHDTAFSDHRLKIGNNLGLVVSTVHVHLHSSPLSDRSLSVECHPWKTGRCVLKDVYPIQTSPDW